MAEEWSFLTKHASVLLCIAKDPGARLRDIAATVGITERTAHGIEAQVQRILGLSDPCQVMLVQLAPDATTVEPLGTVVVQLDDVSLVFNRAHGPYGYQTGQVYLAQQDDERWQLVGDPIEDLADLGRELKATGAT